MTLVIGGAGLGKTTLLAQAAAENRLSPAGRDVWIALEPEDAHGGLAADLVRAVHGGPPSVEDPARAVADAIWSCAPEDVCLLLDDCHHLPLGSPGHEMISDLVRRLPANGHVVIASRDDPELPIGRIAAAGRLLRIAEEDLTYDDDEVEQVAQTRGVDAAALAEAAGWPAMVSLLASTGRAVALEYLWQEVIQPLDAVARGTLAAVVDLGGGDAQMLSDALEREVSLAEELTNVPLLATADDGWLRPHPLWRPMARLRLDPAAAPGVRRRAVLHLLGRQRFDDAYRLIEHTGAWDLLPALCRSACIDLTRHPAASSLRRWLAGAPADARRDPAVALAAGVLAALEDPDHAIAPLQAAVAGFRSAADVAGELGAISHLGRVAWWTNDRGALNEVGPRLTELAARGRPEALALNAVRSSILADLRGDDAAMLEALAEVAPGQLGPAWEPALAWIRSLALQGLGDNEAARVVTRSVLDSLRDPVYRPAFEAQEASLAWQAGDQLDVEPWEDGPRSLDESAASGVQHNLGVAAANLAYRRAHLGDLVAARQLLAEARARPAGDRPVAVVRVATATSALALGEGDSDQAATALRLALADHPLDGPARRAWRTAMVLSYVLVPEVRPEWEALDLRGTWRQVRALAQQVVEVRDGAPLPPAVAAELGDARWVRTWLHFVFAADVALALHGEGRAEGTRLAEALGSPGRSLLRAAATSDDPLAKSASSLLGLLPAIPSRVTHVRLLGPVTVEHEPADGRHPALNRERVRALLTLLAVRPRPSRAELIDALWPDLDERAGANNLRVTLSHLLRVVEPDRGEAEPSYFIRSEGPHLILGRSSALWIDLDSVTEDLAAADRAERDGLPSEALARYEAVVGHWRGDVAADLTDAPWLDPVRDSFRLGHMRALRRAAQLRLAAGEPEVAEAHGSRLLELDPYDEDGHAAVLGAALARSDRGGARARVTSALAALAEVGAEPGPDLLRLVVRAESGELARRPK